MAQAEYDLAKENAVSTDTLYRIGMQRLKIASISRADLLTLKLDVVNARNTLQNAASSLKRAMFSLASFLNLEKNTEIRVELPGRPQSLTIPVDEALMAAQSNNPDFWSYARIFWKPNSGWTRQKRIAFQCGYQCQYRVQPGFGEVQSSLSASHAAGDGFGKRFRSTDRLGGKKRQVQYGEK